MALLLLLGALLLIIVAWLTTVRWHEIASGELACRARFKIITHVIGNGIPKNIQPYSVYDSPEQTVEELHNPDILHNKERPVPMRIDVKNQGFTITFWPYRIVRFDYRYKRFKTYGEVIESEGNIRWMPEELQAALDAAGKEKESKKLSELRMQIESTIVLGEWKEVNKTTLNYREEDDIVLPFKSDDGITGYAMATVVYVPINMAAAISVAHDTKSIPENEIINLFRNKVSPMDFLKDIKGITFDEIQKTEEGSDDFLVKLNKQIYAYGFQVEDVLIQDFILSKNSIDILEAREQKKKEELRGEALEIANAKEAERKTLMAKTDLQILTDKGTVENTLKVNLQKELNGAEIDKIRQETGIKLDAAGKVIDKMINYKQTQDVTEVAVAFHHGKASTLVLTGSSGEKLSGFDDKLVSNTVANFITNPKKKKEEEHEQH